MNKNSHFMISKVKKGFLVNLPLSSQILPMASSALLRNCLHPRRLERWPSNHSTKVKRKKPPRNNFESSWTMLKSWNSSQNTENVDLSGKKTIGNERRHSQTNRSDHQIWNQWKPTTCHRPIAKEHTSRVGRMHCNKQQNMRRFFELSASGRPPRLAWFSRSNWKKLINFWWFIVFYQVSTLIFAFSVYGAVCQCLFTMTGDLVLFTEFLLIAFVYFFIIRRALTWFPF